MPSTPKPKKASTVKTASKKEIPAPAKAVKAVSPSVKPSTKSPKTPKPTKELPGNVEEVAKRAYYISQERQRTGRAGNPTQDWLEAEQQLKAELKPKKAGSKKSKATS